MKLKEKLAIDYAKKLPSPYTDGARALIAEDFIAGFDKAIELVEKRLFEKNIHIDEIGGKDFS